MISKFQIVKMHFWPGAHAGLAEKTAVVRLKFEAEAAVWTQLEAAFRTHAMALCPEEPLHGMHESDWPASFVLDAPASTTLAHWVIALATAMQRWARDPVGHGRVLAASGNAMTLSLPWEREAVCKAALRLALRHILLWSQAQPEPGAAEQLSRDLGQWLHVVRPGGLEPTSLRFALAARGRRIPVHVFSGLIALGYGAHAIRMSSSFTDRTSAVATNLARNKFATNRMLHGAAVPVPALGLVSNQEAAQKIARELGWPVVVKPIDQDQGMGVVTGIRDEAALSRAFEAAAKLSSKGVIVEKHVEGDDHRMLVVGGSLRMTTKRISGGVVGDGVHTVAELVKQVNADLRRGTSKRSLLITLTLDEEAQSCLGEDGLVAESVPEAGRFVRLRRTANISTGGTAVDVTSKVHPDNRMVAERAASLVGLDIAGVDFLCPDISRSWREVGGVVIEVNAQPGFRPHWLGDPERDINGEIVDWLFRDQSARIPTAAITGTNGKSTVARMLHHVWMAAGKNAGVCTTNGVWVGANLISDQNLSGFPGGRMLLNDPTVEVAVIEMPRKGLIVFGHPCDRYDVAALLNMQDDHVGVDGINSLEEMASLKAEVLERASQAIVVNAEDALCLAMRRRVQAARHILVAQDADAPALRAHLNQGGTGVFARMHQGERWIMFAEAAETPLMPLSDIPATMNGLLRFNESNALFAAALAWAQGVSPAQIRAGLSTFTNTRAHNPGRYNFIEGFPFLVLLDYGHNPDGVQELCALVAKLPVKGKRRLLSLALGNRHRAHLDAIAPMIAQAFDAFVLGCDADLVRQSADYVSDDPPATMLAASVAGLLANGVAPAAIETEPDYSTAIQRALASAQPGDLLVLLAEPWDVFPIVEAAQIPLAVHTA